MNVLRFSALALVCACVSVSVVAAEQPATASPEGIAAPAPDPGPAPAPSCCTIPALTVVELEFVDAASSRTSKAGDVVAVRLAEPLVIAGRTVLPAGTRGTAEVIQASKARIMGKAGELTLAARSLELNGVRVPLKRLRYGRSQGSDPTGTLTTLNVAAAAALPIASTALLFVSGGNIEIKPGAPANAVVAADTLVPAAE